MNVMPDMSQAVATIVELEKKNKKALDHSNRPRLSKFDGSDRGEANWESAARTTWEAWRAGCTKLLSDASLTFKLDANGKIELDENGKPTVVLIPLAPPRPPSGT